MSATSLEQVLHHPSIWRGNACARVATPSVSTGYAELDAELVSIVTKLLAAGVVPRAQLADFDVLDGLP